ncbi:hypothetical protein [Natronincola peptidivorans]|uniref:hypothetical protein n=1 Tax=Natronincola peptidivorans TaxID=426128 RepID=UPI000B81BD2F|nr:hypothetical protein [Natronincola peptidivorans]
MFIVVLLIILAFTLFDLPFLIKRKNPLVAFAYSFLLLMGIAIFYILIEDLPVASPAVYIEKALNLILKR